MTVYLWISIYMYLWILPMPSQAFIQDDCVSGYQKGKRIKE